MKLKVVSDLRTGTSTDVKPLLKVFYGNSILDVVYHPNRDGMYLYNRSNSVGIYRIRSPSYSFEVSE